MKIIIIPLLFLVYAVYVLTSTDSAGRVTRACAPAKGTLAILGTPIRAALGEGSYEHFVGWEQSLNAFCGKWAWEQMYGDDYRKQLGLDPTTPYDQVVAYATKLASEAAREARPTGAAQERSLPVTNSSSPAATGSPTP
jgi:hypothetical protein